MEPGSDVEASHSLRDIVRWLTTPARCGAFFSTRDLHRIGGLAGISGLPNNRRFALEQLFRAASIEEKVDTLFSLLIAEVDAHRQSYLECDTPALSVWIDRAAETSRTLAEMRQSSRDESAS